MEGKIVIKYNWECEDSIGIPEKHLEALEEDAQNHIFESIKEGNVCGELNTTVRFGKDIVEQEDEDEGLQYHGWWSMSSEISE